MTRESEADRVRRLCELLREAERPVRILRSIAWPDTAQTRFLASRCKELPDVAYPAFDPTPTLERTAALRKQLDRGSVIDGWLLRHTTAIENGARMLRCAGTADFHKYSRDLYGDPLDALADQSSTSMDLAEKLQATLTGLSLVSEGIRDDERRSAEQVRDAMTSAVDEHFGERAPEVRIVPHLSAKCVAGSRQIRILDGASFTTMDVRQLIHHEVYVHVGTFLNGRAQDDLPILAASHPGTTRTQEGLAVFAEIISGTMGPDRFRRLADRVLAIQMAIEGADFFDVFGFFMERVEDEGVAFEHTRRVFRGGTLDGGSPFTKDIVYLDGLLRVHNFLRAVVSARRVDCLRLLFAGKLDIEDVPALAQLAQMGLLAKPPFLPPWIADLRFLVSYLAYSSFLNRVDMHRVQRHYDDLLAHAPLPTTEGDAPGLN